MLGPEPQREGSKEEPACSVLHRCPQVLGSLDNLISFKSDDAVLPMKQAQRNEASDPRPRVH